MASKKTTRRALFSSVISLVLCMAMLVGTTFAWFTDSATTGMNQIVAGNLDVELLYKNDGKYVNAMDVDTLFNNVELWEPGMVAYETVKIANVGTLALKYAMSINFGNENTLDGHGLSEVLHFAVIPGEIAAGSTREQVLAMAENATDKGMLTTYTFGSGATLLPEAETAPMTLVVYWPENGETDNLYNANNGQETSDKLPLHIDLGLTVFASQETEEEDSFDKFYDDTASYPENMWLGDVAETLVIEGTEILISSGAELAKLAAEVAVGNTYMGYTVKLTDSIDLGNIEWTPIGQPGPAGTTDFSTSFRGIFDGQNKTIYNLKSSGEGWAGLFGLAYKADIKNLTIVNANVSANRMAGAAVGQIYGSIENVHVKNAVVTAVPNAVDNGYDNGDKIGGIVGWFGDNGNNHTLTGCSAEKVYLKAYRDVGGIAGYAAYGNTVSNNTATNVDITADQATNHYGDKDFNAGGIVGRYYNIDKTTVKDNKETDVTISYVVGTEAGLRAAFALGGNVILGADINAKDTFTVPAEKTVTLDLAGCSISQAKGDIAAAYALIDNKGTLTINDSVGTGKVSFADTTPYTADIGWASNTVRNTGTLTVNGGTIENTTAKEVMNYSYPHAIDVYQGSTTTINGGTVKSANYDSIRMFCNSDTLATTVNITGGNIINRVSFQDPQSEKAGYGVLNISGGNFTTTDGVTANVRLLNFCKNCSNMKATVTGGTFDKGFMTQDIGGAGVVTSDWVTGNVPVVVANAAGLQAALNSAVDGDIIVLSADVDLGADNAINVPAGTSVTLDLNGKELSGYSTASTTSYLVNVAAGAEMTIKNGTVSFYATTPDTEWGGEGQPPFPGYANNTIKNTGKLIIDGATIENLTAPGGASYAIDCYQGSELIVNSGVIDGVGKCAIRMFCNSNTLSTNVTINGGTITGKRAIWIQLPGSNIANVRPVNLTITGGKLICTNTADDVCIYSYSYGDSFAGTNITISGGEFTGDVAFGGGEKTTKENVTVTGGIFNGELGRYLADDGWEDIAKP